MDNENKKQGSFFTRFILKFGGIKPKFQYVIKHVEGIYNAAENEAMQIEIKPNCILFQNLSSHTKESINKTDIADIILLKETEETVKEKAALPRVIVGAIIFGMVGGIIGGLSASPKIKENTKYYIQIVLKNGEKKTFTANKFILKTILKNMNIQH